MWKYVATRYAREVAIARYDRLNEPSVWSSGAGAVRYYDVVKLCVETLPAFYERVVDGIRTVHSNHMILWEPAVIYDRVTSPVHRPNVVYSPHYLGYSAHYKSTGIGVSEYGYDGNRTRLEASMSSFVAKLSEEWNAPVLIGEWGICVDAPNAVQYIFDLADLMNRNNLGGAWWTYCKSTFGMTLLDKDGMVRITLAQSILQALSIQP